MITTNKIGFKGFVKNLRKYLKDECNTTLTQSQALETTSQLLGFKNYNIFHSKEKDLENTIKLINAKIDNNTELITDNLNRKFFDNVDYYVVNDLNVEYLHYMDDKGRFLHFRTPSSMYDEHYGNINIILLEKRYFNSIPASKSIEEHIIKLEYDKYGMPFVPNENKLLKELTKDFSVVPFKQYRNDVVIGITLKNPKKDLKFKSVYFEIRHQDIKARLIIEKDNSQFENNWYEIEFNNKKFSNKDRISKEEVMELVDNFNLTSTYNFAHYLTDYEQFLSIKNPTGHEAGKPTELDEFLFYWIIENQIAGFFNSIIDAANLAISFEHYDERVKVEDGFYEAYKHQINNGKEIVIPFYSEKTMFDFKRRTGF